MARCAMCVRGADLRWMGFAPFHKGLISGHFVMSCVFEEHIVHYMRLSL